MRQGNYKLVFLFHNQNISFGYSKEPSHRDGSFEHPRNMFRLLDKTLIMLLHIKMEFLANGLVAGKK